MSEESTNNYTTSDIGIAAYLQLQGEKLIACRRLESGKFYFCFEDSSGQCRLKSLEFLESDFCRFDNNVRNLKKILFS
jgi:hypothetical protein|tara:strand:- start:913 stop:1146 length:234 start_codon:yes stop_codon:yes gene_type:complete